MPHTKALSKKLYFRFMHTTECVVHKKSTLGFCLTVAKPGKINTGRLLHLDVQSLGQCTFLLIKIPFLP